MAAFVVAITGGIASGKSAVTALFQALGVTVADADLAARSVVAVGQPALAEIVERFGPASQLPDGTLDRALLRQRVFDEPRARLDLEAITHPRIRSLLLEQCRAAAGPYAMAAIPLLAETGSRPAYGWLDRVLVVDAPVAVQRARLMLRDGIDPVLADRMIGAQAGRAVRLAMANDIIVNDGALTELEPRVRQLDARYRQLAGKAP